jgi:hypothetical protein
MKILGKSKGSCCIDRKVFVVEEGAPSMIKKKADYEVLVTITFD